MSILPQEIQGEFDYVIGWLRERACARQHGLGTLLPWDKDLGLLRACLTL